MSEKGILVKLSSLRKSDLSSFKKVGEKRYVLARKLQDYGWDTGSVWKLVRLGDGSLAIAREEDPVASSKEVETGILGKQPIEVKAGLSKTAELLEEISEKNVTSIPSTQQMETSYVVGHLVPLVFSWMDSGCKDVSPEGIRRIAKAEFDRGALGEVDKDLVLRSAEILSRYAETYRNPPPLLEEEFPEAQYQETEKVSGDFVPCTADQKIGNILKAKPPRMSTELFVKTFKSLKGMSRD